MQTYLELRIKNFLFDAFDLISFLVFVTWVVLFIRFFVFNPYTVVGQSMEPVFHQGDFIIVDKITPKFSSLKRGDVIVFVPRGKTVPYIKRIIGVPGETVKFKENHVEICSAQGVCEVLDEPYLGTNNKTSIQACKIDEFVVEGTGYFVLWDNRDHSTDSRCCFGLACFEGANYLVFGEDMIGKVALKLYPTIEQHR
jgi:signal peptidase I